MRKGLSVTLLAVLVVAAMALPASAGSPIEEKITGGGHFTSDGGTTVDHLVYLSMVGMEKDGAWSGQGSYRDTQLGLEAHLIVDSGFRLDNEENYVCTEGLADVYVDDAYVMDSTFRVCITDEDWDGLADRIGVILYDYYTYSHMGGAVRDYAGCIKIH